MSDYVFKNIIIGSAGVGKSSLLQQFVGNGFRENLAYTIGVDTDHRIITVDGKTVKLQIWDTAGQEIFNCVSQMYYRGTAGAFLVYDVTDRSSFSQLPRWLEDLRLQCNSHIVITLIGNKIDKEEQRKVLKEEGEELAKKHGLYFTETSAKTAAQVEDAFILAAKSTYLKIKLGQCRHKFSSSKSWENK